MPDKMGATGPEPADHPLVAKLVGGDEPVRSRLIHGYLGPGADEEARQIYFDVELSHWAEVPVAAILLIVNEPRAPSDITAPSRIWLDADAPLTWSRQESPTFTIEELFEGEVAEYNLAAATDDRAAPLASTWPCGISALTCPTTGCLPTPRCTLGSVCTATPKCEPSTPRCPTPPTMKWCTQGGPC